ncbi:MAG: hypothetical protein GY754_19285 [bacterium]|nr:hypothetical protein [bacterium]
MIKRNASVMIIILSLFLSTRPGFGIDLGFEIEYSHGFSGGIAIVNLRDKKYHVYTFKKKMNANDFDLLWYIADLSKHKNKRIRLTNDILPVKDKSEYKEKDKQKREHINKILKKYLENQDFPIEWHEYQLPWMVTGPKGRVRGRDLEIESKPYDDFKKLEEDLEFLYSKLADPKKTIEFISERITEHNKQSGAYPKKGPLQFKNEEDDEKKEEKKGNYFAAYFPTNENPQLLASPQVTVGIKLEDVQAYLTLTSPFFNPDSCSGQTRLEKKVNNGSFKATNNEQKGFILFLGIYLQQMTCIEDSYPKSAHPLLIRNLLNAYAKKVYPDKSSLELFNICLELSKFLKIKKTRTIYSGSKFLKNKTTVEEFLRIVSNHELNKVDEKKIKELTHEQVLGSDKYKLNDRLLFEIRGMVTGRKKVKYSFREALLEIYAIAKWLNIFEKGIEHQNKLWAYKHLKGSMKNYENLTKKSFKQAVQQVEEHHPTLVKEQVDEARKLQKEIRENLFRWYGYYRNMELGQNNSLAIFKHAKIAALKKIDTTKELRKMRNLHKKMKLESFDKYKNYSAKQLLKDEEESLQFLIDKIALLKSYKMNDYSDDDDDEDNKNDEEPVTLPKSNKIVNAAQAETFYSGVKNFLKINPPQAMYYLNSDERSEVESVWSQINDYDKLNIEYEEEEYPDDLREDVIDELKNRDIEKIKKWIEFLMKAMKNAKHK